MRGLEAMHFDKRGIVISLRAIRQAVRAPSADLPGPISRGGLFKELNEI
jgi:hypothetical protein